MPAILRLLRLLLVWFRLGPDDREAVLEVARRLALNPRSPA